MERYYVQIPLSSDNTSHLFNSYKQTLDTSVELINLIPLHAYSICMSQLLLIYVFMEGFLSILNHLFLVYNLNIYHFIKENKI